MFISIIKNWLSKIFANFSPKNKYLAKIHLVATFLTLKKCY